MSDLTAFLIAYAAITVCLTLVVNEVYRSKQGLTVLEYVNQRMLDVLGETDPTTIALLLCGLVAILWPPVLLSIAVDTVLSWFGLKSKWRLWLAKKTEDAGYDFFDPFH